jgi:hypothetical protein
VIGCPLLLEAERPPCFTTRAPAAAVTYLALLVTVAAFVSWSSACTPSPLPVLRDDP